MKYLLAIFCFLSVVGYSGCSSTCVLPLASFNETSQETLVEPLDGEKVPVLVELFTSEGCSSCPPADRILIDIAAGQPYKNADVITLGFHVDYWDHIGWRDRFSSREFTKRQEEYSRRFRLDSTYTPQIVVDGEREVVGNDRKSVGNAISIAGAAKADVKILSKDDKVSISIAKLSEHKGATVFLAIAEDGLKSSVGSGENSGRTLEHASVVRELRKVGTLDAGHNTFSGEFTSSVKPEWKADRVRYVVFIQDDATLKVLGVAATVR